ncbi:MAG: zf-HC2 domain-containing protein, partial [Elusimicrobiota bacterium]|nr:zf-HC2 domain-containing protein [Elusimicrobiota bacterium]
MNCQEIRSLLSRYLEDDLDPDVKNLVEQHLGSCSGCAGELDVLQKMISSLGKLEKVEPPFDFLESIHERLERPSKARLILKRMFYPPHIKLPIEAVVVAATILLVVRIVNFISPGKVMVAMKPALRE